MSYTLVDKLVVATTSRALFDLDVEDGIFRASGLETYRQYQLEHESEVLRPGTAFHLVKALLKINEGAGQRLVEVVLLSQNDADSGSRIFNSIEQHRLDITRAAFCDGRHPYKYLEPFSCNLFLSAERKHVVAALGEGCPAALVYRPPDGAELEYDEVRIAFDGDAVLFAGDADEVFREEGFEAFKKYEKDLEQTPLKPGPLKSFLEAVHRIQAAFPEEKCPIRTMLVTARSAPAHKRPITTLRAWKIRLDESLFLGGLEKARFLRVLRPHIFFDDDCGNLEPAASTTPVAEVPRESGRKGPGKAAMPPHQQEETA